MDDAHEMMIVACINLDEQVILSGREMTLHHFGDAPQGFDHFVKLSRVLQEQADVGTRLITNLLRVDDVLRPLQYAEIGQFLNALVNGCP